MFDSCKTFCTVYLLLFIWKNIELSSWVSATVMPTRPVLPFKIWIFHGGNQYFWLLACFCLVVWLKNDFDFWILRTKIDLQWSLCQNVRLFAQSNDGHYCNRFSRDVTWNAICSVNKSQLASFFCDAPKKYVQDEELQVLNSTLWCFRRIASALFSSFFPY